MASPFVIKSKRFLLGINDLDEILDLLKRHGFSDFRYYNLGLCLGLNVITLRAIEANNTDVSACLAECLKAWLSEADNVSVPTYDTLIQALRNEGENAVADEIEREIYLEVIESPLFSPSTKIQTVQRTKLNICNLDEILGLLKTHDFLSDSYYKLGLYLGLTAATLDNIGANCNEDASSCLRECLGKWLKQADDVKGKGGPTYYSLLRALRKMEENAIADGIDRDLRGHTSIVPPAADPISTEDTPAADRIPDTQNPPTEGKIEKWLKEGEVELEITRINMHGAPGAGKTCSQHLLLNEPPPEKLTDSTPIACPAVKATRISVDDENKWERVDESELLNQLASDLKEAPSEMKQERTPTKINEAQMSMAAPNRLSGPSLEEPTENKPTEKKPSDMEVIKEISDALETGNAKKFSTNWVYFIDSGGQPAYRELLPLFTRAAALNIITIDLTKPLDKKCKFQYRIDQHTSPINTDLKYSNLDIIRSSISSEAMLNPIEIPYVSKMPDHSHYLILGTRKEWVTKEKLQEMNESLREYKANKKVIPHNKRKGSIIFPVNTLLSAGSKEREDASVNLCNAVSNCKVAMVVKLPIRLFTFEIALQREAKKKKQSFLTLHEVIQIGKSLRLDESDIDEALQYLHDVTIILYYRKVLPNIIFVDPKPILDIFSRLIAITYIDHDKLHSIADPPPSADDRSSLIDFGLFKESLLTIIGKQIFNENFQLSHMITLLKHLHIIARVENRKEGDYFFPCALPSYDKLNDPPTEIQPLLIAWKIKNSGTTTLAIPQGLFPLTIVHLLEEKNIEFAPDPDPDPDETKFYRYNDAMSLRVYIKSEEYTIDIINRYTHIELRFYDCKEFCSQIRELVTDAIKESSDDLKVGKNHILAFKCPSENEHSYCIVQDDKSSTRCTQCRSHCQVLQGDSYRCWFSDCQSSSPGSDITPPPTASVPTDDPTSTTTVPKESQVNGGGSNGTTSKHSVATNSTDNTDKDGSEEDLRLPKVCVGKKDKDYYYDELVYLMNTSRGYCLIINMVKNREVGNENDTHKLRTLFKDDLQFAFRVYNNLTAKGIIKLIENVNTKVNEASHPQCCCFIMFILAHGGTEDGSAYFVTSDNEHYKVSVIKKQIESISDLNGKPKLLFLQSCRGGLVDTGLEVLDGNHGEQNEMPTKVPRGSDFLTSYATIEDYVACRGADGSRFIQCLCKVFSAYHKKCDVVTMMTMVTKEVAAIARDVNLGDGKEVRDVRQNPETTFTFRKFLFFGEPPQWARNNCNSLLL